MKTPLLLISDSVSASSGLGRIARDLATRIHKHMGEVIDVATMGYGGAGDRNLPFFQYHIHSIADGWMIPELPEVWQNFAGDRKGIVMTIWDASRLSWFAIPEHCCPDPNLKAFLEKPPFRKWGYFPIDASGPNDKFAISLKQVYERFERVLPYTEWAGDILERTLGWAMDSIPHGIDTSVFYPRPHAEARALFAQKFMPIADRDILIGIVATNQPRKDFGLGIAAAALANEHLHNTKDRIRLWIHTDDFSRHWNLPMLLHDFNMVNGRTFMSNGVLSDDEMAWLYSACAMTIGIGLSEGFGYPIFESLACGTPCIHGSYSGAAEFMNTDFLIDPKEFRYEGGYGCVRPVYSVNDLAKKIAECSVGIWPELPPELDWNNLWPRWEKWISDGLGSLNCEKG